MKISKIIGGALLVCVIGKGAASVSSVPAQCGGGDCCNITLLPGNKCNPTGKYSLKTKPIAGSVIFCCTTAGGMQQLNNEASWLSQL